MFSAAFSSAALVSLATCAPLLARSQALRAHAILTAHASEINIFFIIALPTVGWPSTRCRHIRTADVRWASHMVISHVDRLDVVRFAYTRPRRYRGRSAAAVRSI